MTPTYLKPPWMTTLIAWGLTNVAGAGGPGDLHREATILDLHADTPCQLVRRRGYSLRERLTFNEIDLPRMREGNLAGQFFVLWPPADAVAAGRAEAFCRQALAAIRRAAEESGGIEWVTSADGLRDARARGKVGALLGMEGAECLSGKVGSLAGWHREGVRYLGLTWNGLNPFATPAAARGHGARGLTPLGRSLVAEANRLGVLVDVSHASERTFWDVVRASRAPIIASHSCSRSLRPHPRNLDDEQARAVARSGGVIGVNFFSLFLKPARERATVEDVARHVVHLVRVAGAAHVALGSDFDGYIRTPVGLEDVSKLPNLTAALLRRGLTPAQIRQVLGENVLRVLGDASRDVHRGARRVPLDAKEVRPAGAHRLLDRNDLTRFTSRGTVRFAVRGQPTHLALHPCGRGRLQVELRRAGEEKPAWAEEMRLEGDRIVRELPPMAAGLYRARLGGKLCLREVTVYGP
jgi:membrane dipeptidase